MQRPMVIKVGTNVLTDAQGAPDTEVLTKLVAELAHLHAAGQPVVLVSSGAMGFGQAALAAVDHHPATTIGERQLFSAVGQVTLMRRYAELFATHRLTIGQVLATTQDFQDRDHYFNMRQCLQSLLEAGVIPILNENDAVSVSELMFTDNDELAGLVAAMLDADRLFILTSVDGVFTGNPTDPANQLIPELLPDQLPMIDTTGQSTFGRGGMRTKLTIARRLANLGIAVHILNGKHPQRLRSALAGKPEGTVIRPVAKRSGAKRRLGFADREATLTVTINDGARERLIGPQPVSLLPVGIIRFDGSCQKGDVVRIVTQAGTVIGIGRAEYGSDRLAQKLGQRGERPFIHYNYLVMYE